MTVTHDKDTLRFLLWTDENEQAGSITYQPNRPGVIAAVTTNVPGKFEGRGYAAMLLEALAGYAREEGLKIMPVCSYVVHAFQKYPEKYGDVSA